jgi:subfamily B ATP-binding cassette protein MsbA/ATP-binding cassette subfamily B protein AbcA/BmrA
MILKDAPIMLLDEPTAALDTQSEAEVLDTLTRLMVDKTVVIISHRLSSLRGVDEILVVDNGSIRARGTHAQLIAQDELYRQFVERQAIRDESAITVGGSS